MMGTPDIEEIGRVFSLPKVVQTKGSPLKLICTKHHWQVIAIAV